MVDSLYLEISKITDDCKSVALTISFALESVIEEEDTAEIMCLLDTVSVFHQVLPEHMAKEQHKDPILSLVCQYITARETLKTSAINKMIKGCMKIHSLG